MFLLTRQLTIEKYDEIKIVEKLFLKIFVYFFFKLLFLDSSSIPSKEYFGSEMES